MSGLQPPTLDQLNRDELMSNKLTPWKPGLKCGRLTVLIPAGKAKKADGTYKKGGLYALCVCECGKLIAVQRGQIQLALKNNRGRLGCYDCSQKLGHTKHGLSQHYINNTLALIKNRCRNPKDKDYKNYGGRGIECRFEKPDQLLAEVGERPSKQHTIDRIDNNGHYEPGNVRWATKREQSENSRKAFWMEYKGKPITAINLSRLTGIQSQTLRWRWKRGYREEQLCASTERCK